jgi:hypothetical protein
MAVMNIPAPLPGDPRDEVWTRAATTWQQALSVATGHLSPRLLVGVLDVVAGCSAGRVVRPPHYPILLWIDIAPVRTASGMDAVTIGLSSFVGREIEFEVGRLNPSAVLSQVAGLASYLIEHGNVIKDGNTFGGSEAERIRVRHAVS